MAAGDVCAWSILLIRVGAITRPVVVAGRSPGGLGVESVWRLVTLLSSSSITASRGCSSHWPRGLLIGRQIHGTRGCRCRRRSTISAASGSARSVARVSGSWSTGSRSTGPDMAYPHARHRRSDADVGAVSMQSAAEGLRQFDIHLDGIESVPYRRAVDAMPRSCRRSRSGVRRMGIASRCSASADAAAWFWGTDEP